MRAKREIERSVPKRIYVLITHMHNDHVSGIPTLAEWLKYRCPDYSDSLHICAPEKMLVYMARELFEYRNLTDDMVTFVTTDAMCRKEKSWLISAVPTVHVGEHFEGLCYGYLLSIGYLRVLYSGDTRSLDPFLPISCDEFYCDMSNFSGPDRPHLSWELDGEALVRKADDCDAPGRDRGSGSVYCEGVIELHLGQRLYGRMSAACFVEVRETVHAKIIREVY